MKKEIHSITKYIKLVSDSDISKEKNSCVPLALTALTQKPYNEVYKYLADRGRRKGHGTSRSLTMGFLLENKFAPVPDSKLVSVYINGGRKVERSMTVGTFSKNYPNGRYLLFVRSHVVAVIDGEILDTWDSSKRRVTSAFTAPRE
jgi:hypothetical protein